MRINQIRRGDIYYADLNPVIGSEQGDTRPVLVVQNNIGNKHSPTVVVVPLTSSKKAFLPTHVRVSRMRGLNVDSTALTEQVRTIDKSRLDGYIGRIGAGEQLAVDGALAVSVGLAPNSPSEGEGLVLSLCYRCKCEFEAAGRVLVKCGWQEYKEPCDRCRVGMGLDYMVFEKKEEEACYEFCA